MIRRCVLGAAIAMTMAGAALADPPITADAATAADAPLGKARALAMASVQAVREKGPVGVGAYAKEMEADLQADALPIVSTGKAAIVAYDSPEEKAAYIAWINSPEGLTKAPAVSLMIEDPYVLMSFELGSYYNEISRPDLALPALEHGVTLIKTRHDLGRSGFAPVIYSERGVALASLKRWPDALAAYDAGLAIPGLAQGDQARMHRGRGYALVELDRLDEAEAAYKTSLQLEPGNPIAMQELDYIVHLRAGMATPQPRVLITPGRPVPKAQMP